MDKYEVYEFLKARNIWYEVSEYQTARDIQALASADLRYPEADAKNLFLRDNKKRNYYLLTVKEGKNVDLKAFRQKYNTRPLSFASEQDLMEILGLLPGTVNPLALLNDQGRRVQLFLDEALISPLGLIGIHPNDNTAIVWLKTQDLIDIVKEHGSKIVITKL